MTMMIDDGGDDNDGGDCDDGCDGNDGGNYGNNVLKKPILFDKKEK